MSRPIHLESGQAEPDPPELLEGSGGQETSPDRLRRAWSCLHGWLSLSRDGLLGGGDAQESAERVAAQALSALGR